MNIDATSMSDLKRKARIDFLKNKLKKLKEELPIKEGKDKQMTELMIEMIEKRIEESNIKRK